MRYLTGGVMIILLTMGTETAIVVWWDYESQSITGPLSGHSEPPLHLVCHLDQ